MGSIQFGPFLSRRFHALQRGTNVCCFPQAAPEIAPVGEWLCSKLYSKAQRGSSLARWWSALPMRPRRYDKAIFTGSAVTWSSKPYAQRYSSRAGRESSTLRQRRCQPPSRMSPLRYWRMGGVPVTRPPCPFPVMTKPADATRALTINNAGVGRPSADWRSEICCKGPCKLPQARAGNLQARLVWTRQRASMFSMHCLRISAYIIAMDGQRRKALECI